MKKQKLKVDWSALLPGKEVTVLGNVVTILPMGLRAITGLSRRAVHIIKALRDNEITWENFQEEEKIPDLLFAIVNEIPDLLSDLSGIREQDVERLPLEDTLKLVEAVIDVNISDMETFEKNAASLTGIVKKLVDRIYPEDEENPESETESSTSE